MKKPRYSAVVLTDESSQKALDIAEATIPNIIGQAGWEPFAHHMTIKMGGLRFDKKSLVGEVEKLTVNAVGISGKALALRVDKDLHGGKLSTNEVPHITVAVHRVAGGKPFDSNKIEEWTEIKPIILTGHIREVF